MPLSNQIHRNRPLENISIAYKPGQFVADRLVPRVPVKHESDTYYVFDTDIMSLPETIRANGARANRVSYNMSTSSYRLDEHSLKDVVTDRDRNNADKAISLDIDITESLTNKILIRREYECAQIAQSGTHFSNNASLTSTYAWSANTTLSNPIIAVDSATSKIISSSGYTPNKMVIDDTTYRACRVHTSIVDRIKYTTADSITESMLAKLFDIGELLVGRAIYDGSDEGLSTDMTNIWTNAAFIGYMEPNPGLRKPSAMYQLNSTTKGSPTTVKKWRDEEVEGDWIEVGSMFQFKAIATSCGYVIIDTA